MKNIVQNIQITLPILLGYIPLGMVFGFLMTSQGMDWYMAPLFSIFAYAGAIQFLAIPMLLAQVNYLDIAITTLFVNFRHVFYGMSVLDYVPTSWLKKLYFIFGITDESYSLLTSCALVNQRNAFSIVLLNHFYWVAGTLLGATMASQAPSIAGLDFALTALFVVLFIEQVKKRSDKRALLIAFGSCLLAWVLFVDNFLVAAILIALTAFYLEYKLSFKAKVVSHG